jgi:hypothetical protein
MATILTEAVHEALPELEGEIHELESHELEAEEEMEGAAPVWRAAYPAGEGEAETEAFFESIAEYAVGSGGGGGRGHGLGAVAGSAAAAALGRGPSAGVPLAITTIAEGPGGYVEGEAELEGGSLEAEMLMEHFGHAAAEAETEAEMEAFIFPLLPLAAKFLAPKLLSFGAKKILPQLAKSAVRMVGQLRRNPATRPLVRMAPTIVRRTMRDIAQQVERGRPLTPEVATRFLARETRRVLEDPRQVTNAYRRSRALDRRYHTVCYRVQC